MITTKPQHTNRRLNPHRVPLHVKQRMHVQQIKIQLPSRNKILIQRRPHHPAKLAGQGVGNHGNPPVATHRDYSRSQRVVTGKHGKIRPAIFEDGYGL